MTPVLFCILGACEFDTVTALLTTLLAPDPFVNLYANI